MKIKKIKNLRNELNAIHDSLIEEKRRFLIMETLIIVVWIFLGWFAIRKHFSD